MADLPKQVYRVLIDAPIERVWDALTRRDAPLKHFFGSVMHTTRLEPGAPIRMRSKNGKFTGVVGEIIECDPPHRFSHTFKFTALDDSPCVVTYELRETEPSIVEFTLTTERVPAGTKTAKYMASGGKHITKTLKHVVERGRPHARGRFVLLMITLTQWTTPKRCRSERWPLENAAA